MKKLLASSLGYLVMAILGSMTAYLLVQQFLPQAQSQDPTEMMGELDPGLEPDIGNVEQMGDMPAELPEEFAEDIQGMAGESAPQSDAQTGEGQKLGSIESLVDDGYFYNPEGKRDPFQPYVRGIRPQEQEASQPVDLAPLQRFDLGELKLVSIMWDIDDPKAMIIAPDENVHIVGPNDKLGRNNGYIAVIREGELVIVESFEESGEVKYNTRVMAITR